VVLSGCAHGSDAKDGRVGVVASFYPLAEAAREIGGSRVVVTNLTPPGVEPHDLELAPDDVEALATADLVVYLGGGFQPAVEDALRDAEGETLDALSAVTTEPPPAGEADTLSLDPHVWLDPVRYASIVHAIAGALASVEPSGASAFRANADAFVSRLERLDEEYRSGLASCERRTIVTSHAAFGYLARRYGLTQVAISGLSPEAEPDPAQLAQLGALVEREGVTTIFSETLASPKVAETLADEAGVEVAVLDPLEGLTDREVQAGADYVSVMRSNLATLRDALGCS
jgi:zinc transport system substrate-binding protein